MKKHRLFLMVCMCIFVHAKGNHLGDHILLSAKLDGSQEVPAVATNALGVASVMINGMRDSACVNVSVTGLSGAITGMHIHDGLPGVNGPILVDLTPFVSGNRMTMLINGLADTLLTKLLSGELYVNVHTASNPNGEIRGQLTVETDYSFPVSLNGSLEVPPVTTAGYGVGVFNMNHDSSQISYYIVTQDLSGPITAAHLHGAPLGASGGIIVNLTSGIDGNVITGTINNPNDTLIDSLFAGNIYVNVHTGMNPAGEIRSQLLHVPGNMYFDARLNGNQEVPAVVTTGRGVMSAWLNPALDTLWYDVAADSLSGPIIAAHFHHAPAGSPGGVEIDLTASITGNRLTGIVTAPALTDSVINKFLKGEIYINLHTDSSPSGEIRGQVYRLMREGYVFSMDGDQEVPPVVTTATGSGIVSINRDQNHSHFMLVADGLAPTASHFHTNVAGQAGGVAFDIMPFMMNNGWFGHWTSTSTPPFTPTQSLQFRSDSMYVNVHTSANPSGEIRGQVLRVFECAQVPVGINEPENSGFALIYPNPVSDMLTIEWNDQDLVELSIYDIAGKNIYKNAVKGTGKENIDVKDFHAGLYTVVMRSANSEVRKLFMKY